MLYREHQPEAALAQFVECFWSGTVNGGPLDHRVVPDGCLDIVFSAVDGLRVVGAMTRWRVFSLPAGTEVVGVRFHPGMGGRFLGVAPAELTDRLVPLEDISGAAGRRLWNRLGEARCVKERVSVLAAGLHVRQGGLDEIEQAVRAVTIASGEASIDEIARQAGMSVRQFRRRCLQQSGLTPKFLCRILRFRRALGLLGAGAHDGHAHLAAECGYYDQAHFIRDFRQFSGQAPLAYAARLPLKVAVVPPSSRRPAPGV